MDMTACSRMLVRNQIVDAMDEFGKWYEAYVVAVRARPSSRTPPPQFQEIFEFFAFPCSLTRPRGSSARGCGRSRTSSRRVFALPRRSTT